MDSFYDLFINFLKLFVVTDVNREYSKLLDFIEKIFICVLKMNERLKGLEQHVGE